MPETKPFVLPSITSNSSGRVVGIEYRASVEYAEADVLPVSLRGPKGAVVARLVGLSLRWDWIGANPVEQKPGATPRVPHWAFDHYHSRAIVQRRTAQASDTAASWGAPLTRTLDTLDGWRDLLEATITAYAPSDEPQITWLHRDR